MLQARHTLQWNKASSSAAARHQYMGIDMTKMSSVLQMLFGACPSCPHTSSYGGSPDFTTLTAAAQVFKDKGGLGAFIWSAEHLVSGNHHLDADFTTIFAGGALSN